MPSDPLQNPQPLGARVIALERRLHLITVLLAILIVIFLVDLLSGGVIEAAFEDYQQFPREVRQRLVYMTTIALPNELAEQGEIALRFALPSLSRTVVLERQLPVQVIPKLWRVDITDLGWEGVLPQLLKEHYPYRRYLDRRPLVVRADWFVQYFLDQRVSGNAYFQLLFGDQPPKTEAEFRKLFGTQDDSQFALSHIENDSGVSLAKIRQVDATPTTTAHAFYSTKDSAVINSASDPLGHLAGGFTYEASELIASMPKVSLTSGEMGLLQAYALADGDGNLQVVAPAQIVVDSTNVRGVEIRNPLSCISCHTEGLKALNENAVRSYVQSGALLAAQKPLNEQIERRHLAKLDRMISRHNEDYGRTVLLATGVDAETASSAVRSVVQWYDSDVSLSQAAREVAMTPDDLVARLADSGVDGKSLPARVAALAHGMAIKRTIWEELFSDVANLAP